MINSIEFIIAYSHIHIKKLKKIFFYYLLLAAPLIAQPDFKINRDLIQSGNFFNSELHYFPVGDEYTLFYSYKIPYAQLFFQKEDDHFTSGLKVSIEIKDSINGIVKRIFDERNISVKDFEVTNSRSSFLQGLLSLQLAEGKYKIFAVISDKSSKLERKPPPMDLEISKSFMILNPIILESEKDICDNKELYILSNNSTAIPFNKPENILAIPVIDSTIKSLTINVKSVESEKDFQYNIKVTEFVMGSPKITLCNDRVTIPVSENGTPVKYFLIKNFASKLDEGPIKLEVIPNDDVNRKTDFNLNVVWIGKPLSLLDTEEAIKYLNIIEPNEKVSELLSSDDNKNALYNYWKPFDPTSETNYNELMSEFYQRIDYSEFHFRTISGNDGAKSDRGKTYIKFGQPDRIERNTNNEDHIVENWFYNNPKRTFVFIDKDGTGKFNLATQQ